MPSVSTSSTSSSSKLCASAFFAGSIYAPTSSARSVIFSFCLISNISSNLIARRFCGRRELLYATNVNLALIWRATRGYSLPASVVPVVLGTALAARGYAGAGAGRFDAVAFLLVLLGGMLAHLGANVLNDYFDFVKGVDTRPEHGSGVLTRREIIPSQALAFGLCLMAGAAICAVPLLRNNAAFVIALSLVGFGCAVLYSAFLKKYALGDLLIVLAFGLGLTLGAYGVQVHSLPVTQWLLVAFYSLPICLLVDAILHANNMRDAADDRAVNVRTLATLLSPNAARALQVVLLFGPPMFVIIAIATRLLPMWSAATLLSIPLLLRAYRTGSVEGTAQTHLVFGLLYALSFLPKPVYL